MYSLQHGSLFVTSFVFLMGLLFKVDGVSASSPTYYGLSIVMVAMCGVFLLSWLCLVFAGMVRLILRRRANGKDAFSELDDVTTRRSDVSEHVSRRFRMPVRLTAAILALTAGMEFTNNATVPMSGICSRCVWC